MTSPNSDLRLPGVTNADLDRAIEYLESGAQVLDTVEKFLRRFIAYPSEHARVAHALWIAHTHRMDAWGTTPRLAFMSAEKESGKTRALEVTSLLVPEPLLSISISPAAMVRVVAEGECTILFDEIDALFGSTTREEGNLDVRSILNGGYRRGATVPRCVIVGREIKVQRFNSFAPVALAGLRELPDTIASRAIIIRMRRRAPDEIVEPWRERRIRPEGETVKRRIIGWIDGLNFEGVEPEMPPGIEDRAGDCWEPLFAIADAAGGRWPERARAAALHLTAAAREESLSPGVELLDHIREAFGEADALPTETLLERLRERPESPWRDVRGKPLDDRGLARRLRGFGIRPRAIRVGGQTPRGYRREDFVEAWRRYCPQASAREAQQAQQVQQTNNFNDLTLRSGVQQAQQVQHEPHRMRLPAVESARRGNGGAEPPVADGVADVALSNDPSATLSDCNSSNVADVADVALRRQAAVDNSARPSLASPPGDGSSPGSPPGAPVPDPAPSDDRGGPGAPEPGVLCAWCGRVAYPNDPIAFVSFGAGAEAHLHRSCERPWAAAVERAERAARRANDRARHG